MLREVQVGQELAIRLWDAAYNVGQIRDVMPLGSVYIDGTAGDRVIVVRVERIGRHGLQVMDEAPAGAEGCDDA